MGNSSIPSKRAESELKMLGQNIATARKRRQFTQQRLAEGAGVSRASIRRLEAGDPGVSIGSLAMVLLTLGESGRLGQLLDVARDDVGLVISVSDLPQRVRAKGRSKKAPAQESRAHPPAGQREPEAF